LAPTRVEYAEKVKSQGGSVDSGTGSSHVCCTAVPEEFQGNPHPLRRCLPWVTLLPPANRHAALGTASALTASAAACSSLITTGSGPTSNIPGWYSMPFSINWNSLPSGD